MERKFLNFTETDRTEVLLAFFNSFLLCSFSNLSENMICDFLLIDDAMMLMIELHQRVISRKIWVGIYYYFSSLLSTSRTSESNDCRNHALLFSLTIRPYRPFVLVSSLCVAHWTEECKFLQIGKQWCLHMLASFEKTSIMSFPEIFWSAWQVLLASLRWFTRWEVSGLTVVVL